jgi:hypothetical protein
MPRPAAFATVNDDMVAYFQRWFSRTGCPATTEARQHASGRPVDAVESILAVADGRG